MFKFLSTKANKKDTSLSQLYALVFVHNMIEEVQ